MTEVDIIDALRGRLAIQGGRHLYGILGSYVALARFSETLVQATRLDGQPFPKPTSVSQGILDAIPDPAFRSLVENEARQPTATSRQIKDTFETFIRKRLASEGLIVLTGLEIIFVYRVDLGLLRTLAADRERVVLLLPGRRERGEVLLFDEAPEFQVHLPTNLFADNHLWELTR